MDVFEAAGVVVVPLFDGLKHPNWKGYKGVDPLNAAADYIGQRRDRGAPVKLTGRYVLLNGWGAVIDPEGRKWHDRSLPLWMRAVKQAADVLPSWISAGGDGGQNVRNVLVPLPYERICRDLGVTAGEGVAHRVPLGDDRMGELLLKWGVCVPVSRVGERTVVWDTELSLDDAVKSCEEIWDDLSLVLRSAIADGVASDREDGTNAGDEPVVPSVARALNTGGADAGVEATAAALDNGASRHYLVKTWANWAFIMFGNQEWLKGDEGVESLIGRIGELWAYAAGFEYADVRKAVLDERRYCASWVGR